MSDPLTSDRLAWLVAVLDVLSLPFSALAPVPLQAASVQRCGAFLFFLQLAFCVLLPLAILARTEWRRPPDIPPPAPAGELPGRRMRRRLERAAAAANHAVWRCCTLPSGASGAACAWAGLSLAWTVTLYLHGL